VGHQQGDIIIYPQLSINPSDGFTLVQQQSSFDLQKKIEISLYEYFYGVDFKLKHLDGRLLHIKAGPFYTMPDTTPAPHFLVHRVVNEGLLKENFPSKSRGDLLIIFDFKLSNVDPEAIKILYPPLN